MRHEENTRIYAATKGKLIVRKADDFIMGDAIDLGTADQIENYEEREFSKEEIKAFYESIGMEPPVEEEETTNEEEE